jgi:pimeloyl-ACP methyl ester carboxylesterase
LLDKLFAGENTVLDARVREHLPGKTAWLTDGVTYYEFADSGRGTPVILIHGFSVPNFIWDPTYAGQSSAGFRVLRYDLFGRGYSDRPRLRYDKALFVRQLADLMDALGIEQADLVSLSMGGVIAAEFAYRFPKRVRKLAFVDPAGFNLQLPWTIKLLNVPVLGELVLGALGRFGAGTLLDSMLGDFYNPTQEAKDYFVPRYLEQMRYHGFKRAILSSLRMGMLDEDLGLFERVGKLDKEVLLIWGKGDQTVPFHYNEVFRKLVPQTQFHAIDEARHIPHFERPELVNQLLTEFLNA